MKGPSFAEVAAAKLREAQRLVKLQRSYDAECVASDAKAGEAPGAAPGTEPVAGFGGKGWRWRVRLGAVYGVLYVFISEF